MTTSNANRVMREQSALDVRRGVSVLSQEPHCTKYSAHSCRLWSSVASCSLVRAPEPSPLEKRHCPRFADGVRRRVRAREIRAALCRAVARCKQWKNNGKIKTNWEQKNGMVLMVVLLACVCTNGSHVEQSAAQSGPLGGCFRR